MKSYLTYVLNFISGALGCEDEDQEAAYRAELLRDVLDFNRDRVKFYVSSLRNSLELCIATYENGGSSLGELLPFALHCPTLTIVKLSSDSSRAAFAQDSRPSRPR